MLIYHRYGYYGHEKNPKSIYEEIHDEYAQWKFSPRVSSTIKSEVQAIRNDVGMFDLSPFGKVSSWV